MSQQWRLPMSWNRRDFLLTGAAVAATAGIASPASAQAPQVPAQWDRETDVGVGGRGAQAPQGPAQWDRETDVVVIGAGATGLPAAIVAREAGASVILVEAEKDIGGHATLHAGKRPVRGGTTPR